jgi:alpha-tubulin suppressor-like RCC1 family protein
LGDGTRTSRFAPVKVGTGFAAVVTGELNSFGIKTDGSLWAWGSNGSWALGDGTNVDRLLPVQIGTGYSEVSSNSGRSVALKTDGSLWVWGGDALRKGESPTLVGAGYLAAAAGCSGRRRLTMS